MRIKSTWGIDEMIVFTLLLVLYMFHHYFIVISDENKPYDIKLMFVKYSLMSYEYIAAPCKKAGNYFFGVS